MDKLITAFKRRQGMSVGAFRERMATVYARQAGRMPGLVRYIQNTPGDSAYTRGREPAFDAVEEMWFDAGGASAPTECIEDDIAGFIDPASRVSLPVEEVPLIDGPHTATKLIMFVRRRSDLSPSEFQVHWRDVHGPISVRNPYLRRYVQWHVADHVADANPAFDGVGMVWFDTMDEMRASGSTPSAVEAEQDGARFADSGGPVATLLVSETMVLP